MPSPFPGMDPYLEDPKIWPDVHDALAAVIRERLNATLPARYYAQLGAREEVSLVEEERPVIRVPDVAIHDRGGASGVSVAIDPETDESIEVQLFVTSKTSLVEIIDARGRNVVTIIEIVSPWNKSGGGREEFNTRRAQILRSSSSYVEIDLLRSGDRTWPYPFPQTATEEFRPRPEYVAVINRAWQRGESFRVRIHKMFLQRPLPAIAIPLAYDDPAASLDLQAVFHQVYDGGPYRRGAIDYGQPPAIPLTPEQSAWANDCLKGAAR